MSRSPNTAHPDFEDKNAMLIRLRAHLLPNKDGTFSYFVDWSDLRIAETCNPNIKFKAHHAATIRRAKFGRLGKPPLPAPPPPSRIDILEQRVARIIDILATNSPRSAQHRRYLLDGSSLTAHLDDI